MKHASKTRRHLTAVAAFTALSCLFDVFALTGTLSTTDSNSTYGNSAASTRTPDASREEESRALTPVSSGAPVRVDSVVSRYGDGAGATVRRVKQHET